MLKLISTLDTYQPWSGAVDTYETIVNNDLLDDLEYLLEDIYPDGIDETKLNDILWFDSDWVLESLGLEVDND